MRIAALLAAGILASCLGNAAARAQTEAIIPIDWTSKLHVSHPLAGKIFKGTGDPALPAMLIKQAQLTKFVLIGEIHDNPDHHVIQANLIKAIASTGRRPSVVLEMVPRSLAREVSKYDLAADPGLDKFSKAVKWEERGWYSWDIYRPVAVAAARNNLPMVAGNLDSVVSRAISKSGLEALTADQIKDFALNSSLSNQAETGFLNDLHLSHCELMPKSALPAMLKVQRARDGSMADAMIKSGFKFGSVLIAGNGHVRKDRGVPFVLETLLPGSQIVKLGDLFGGGGGDGGEGDNQGETANVQVRVPNAHNLSIALVEVEADKSTFTDYELQARNGSPVYDYVIFSPKYDDTDHCATLREQFKTTKKPHDE